jgi:hypothetical protein
MIRDALFVVCIVVAITTATIGAITLLTPDGLDEGTVVGKYYEEQTCAKTCSGPYWRVILQNEDKTRVSTEAVRRDLYLRTQVGQHLVVRYDISEG